MKKVKLMRIILLVIAISLPCFAFNQAKNEGQENDSDKNSIEFEYGKALAFSFRRGCSIFVGRIISVNEPVKNNEAETKSEKDSMQSPTLYTKINLSVKEVLWGDDLKAANDVQLKRHYPYVNRLVGDGWNPWYNVDLQLGGKLLIVRYKEKVGDQEYGLIVSDESLFPSIRETISHHIRFIQTPDAALDAPKILSSQIRGVFGGYLVHYFRTGGYANTANDVIVLSQLLGNKALPESSWYFIERALTLKLLKAQTENSISETTRQNVIYSLIEKGCSNDPQLFKFAIRSLTSLREADIAIRFYMSEQQRKKLIENYKTLVATKQIVDSSSKLKAELGIQ
jgi:hypothetical protein